MKMRIRCTSVHFIGIPLLVVLIWCFTRWIMMDVGVADGQVAIGSPINPVIYNFSLVKILQSSPAKLYF